MRDFFFFGSKWFSGLGGGQSDLLFELKIKLNLNTLKVFLNTASLYPQLTFCHSKS